MNDETRQLLPENRKYKRFETPEVKSEDINNVLEMCISSLKGHQAKYPDNAQGLEEFKQASIDYLQYIASVNNEPCTENFLVPDVESWACYLGLTRMTILTYEKNRGADWQYLIAQVKEAIASCKKQLAFRQKIPSVIAMFDLTNNHGYVNSNEFKIQPQVEVSKRRGISREEFEEQRRKINLEYEKKFPTTDNTTC